MAMNNYWSIDDSLLASRHWPSLPSDQQPKQSLWDRANIFRRTDVCYQAFGQGWSTSTCAPSKTLCCLNDNSNYPQCEQYLGLGWCCIAYQSNCYIDLGNTSCAAKGSVQCTELDPGTDEACCLPNTSCASGYNASATYARCNIQQQDLQALASASASTKGTTRTSTTTRSTTSLTSTDLAATSSKSTAYGIYGVSASASTTSSNTALPTQVNNDHSLSSGAIAGIAIGPVLAVLLILAIAFFFWRRRSRKRQLEATGPAAQYHDLQPQPQYGNGVANTYYSPAYVANETKSREMAEMPAQGAPNELSAENSHLSGPAELAADSRK